MKLTVYNIFAVFIFACFGANAQTLDLDELRTKPDSNSLTITQPAFEVRPVRLPASLLDLNVLYWRHWSSFGINANQASFSENWNAGGVNTISLGLLANHKSDYTKNNTNFVTELRLQYGKVKNKGQLAKKSQDRIFWDNKLSLSISKSWSLFTSVTFESQFDAGLRYKTVDGIEMVDTIQSSFMAPGYLTESFGLEYKPDKTFSLRIGTGAARQTFLLDERLIPREGERPRFGIEAGKRFRNELAFQLTANLDRPLTDNLNLKSRYNMFANYNEISDPNHELEAILTARVTRLINVTLNGRLIYNSDVDEKIQTSQTLALGLLYKIPK